MIIAHPEYNVDRNLPRNFEEKDRVLFQFALSVKITPTTVEVVNNVDILRNTIFNRYKLKFYSNHALLQKDSIKEKICKLLMLCRSSKKVDKAIWIIDSWSSGYFHWFTDALPRLIASEKLLNNHVVLLPKAYQKEEFILQSLEMLDMQVEFYSTIQRVHLAELILPSHTAPVSGNYNQVYINKVRDKFLRENNLAPTRKIYISRKKANKRKILNEDSIVPLLESFGYELHYFEDYEFKDQLTLMHQTKYLVSLHGAGLTNMLFMAKGGKILELRNANDPYNNCYFSLASDLNHNYYYLSNIGNTSETHNVNITVDIPSLIEVLELMEA
ncbi:DUF563 domain-containing protein [Pontibacter sp. SGAir0037]|uniref:glycosyltransferase family 61 protein n=1 Tax=Pontibacter sp. SGAir0037 TaxID=2571030 RepID=UPI0010CD3BA1|nr:glycosyltransferase family 61 protein [Pontibacter sp. SGAir0037]QCR22179.1 hypothetical protein C1N53_07375 [Pontibacter sp. SGAir0037]